MNTPVPTPPSGPDSSPVAQKARHLPVLGGLVVAAVLIFIVWGFWRSAQPAAPFFQGQMEARETDVAPKVTARISKVLVTEGQRIQPGDLLYFYSISTHVGMYFGNGQFVHAANPARGVVVDSLNSYYKANLVAASRP